MRKNLKKILKIPIICGISSVLFYSVRIKRLSDPGKEVFKNGKKSRNRF